MRCYSVSNGKRGLQATKVIEERNWFSRWCEGIERKKLEWCVDDRMVTKYHEDHKETFISVTEWGNILTCTELQEMRSDHVLWMLLYADHDNMFAGRESHCWRYDEDLLAMTPHSSQAQCSFHSVFRYRVLQYTWTRQQYTMKWLGLPLRTVS